MPDLACTSPALQLSPKAGFIARGKTQLFRLFAAVELALQVQRERRMLRALDDRALKDLGLNGGPMRRRAGRSGTCRATACAADPDVQSSGWMCTIQPSWSTYQTETGLVELSIQASRSML